MATTSTTTTPQPPTPPAPLAYAGESAAVGLPARARPWPLLVPNVAAVSVLFLHLHNNESPVEPVINYARLLLRAGASGPGVVGTWEAMITGPFLLAIPLALWTLRLSLAPRPRPAERAVAWSLTLTSLLMTLLCLGYCVSLRDARFIPPVVAATVVLGVGAACALILWRVRRSWPTALLAMTTAWAANTTLAGFLLLSHRPWRVGLVVALLVVVAQLVAMIVCVRRWHAAALTSS